MYVFEADYQSTKSFYNPVPRLVRGSTLAVVSLLMVEEYLKFCTRYPYGSVTAFGVTSHFFKALGDTRCPLLYFGPRTKARADCKHPSSQLAAQLKLVVYNHCQYPLISTCVPQNYLFLLPVKSKAATVT